MCPNNGRQTRRKPNSIERHMHRHIRAFRLFAIAVCGVALINAVACAYVSCRKDDTYPSLSAIMARAGQLDKQVFALHDAIVQSPKANEFHNVGEHQRIVIDIETLRSALPYAHIKAKPPHLIITTGDTEATYELRWVGRQCSVTLERNQLILDFVNAYTSVLYGTYVYSIYDEHGHVWQASLFSPFTVEGKELFAIHRDDLNVCEDKKHLEEYKIVPPPRMNK